MAKQRGARPRIAVPAMSSNKIQGLRFSGSVAPNALLEAITQAGGIPLVIYPGAALPDWEQIDGVVVPGGWDVNPESYGQSPHELVRVSDYDDQDEADCSVIQAVEEARLPALLICRGLQLWNVIRGGTLVQHWPTSPQDHSEGVHEVDVRSDSRLAQALGCDGPIHVSSVHHQAVGDVGKGLQVISRASDGCVEAVEDPNFSIIAVQWHPEDRASTCATDQALFDWLIGAAQNK